MLRILPAQMSALADLALEDEIAVDLARHFPRHARLLGEPRLVEVGRRAHLAARAHGFDTSQAAACFARLGVMLGTAFDRDPLLPWTREVLGREGPTVDAPVDHLYDAALVYLHEVAADFPRGSGPAAPTLKQLRALERAELELPIADWIAATFPARCRELGPAGLATLLSLAAAQAGDRGLGERGAPILALLMAAFGTGFADDPALPWPSGVVGTKADHRAWVTTLASALEPWVS